jgi:hypothetical protein
MADQLYLSLWFPNLRLEGLAPALESVISQFSAVGGSSRVFAATVYPLSWSEPPVFQQIYGEGEDGATPKQAITDALELLHEDFAYEFQIRWELWASESEGGLDPIWKKEPRFVRVIAFGPQFDDGVYDQEGHIRIDFGIDTAFLLGEVTLDEVAADRVKQNIQQLVELTNSIQQNCNISSRLLWSESGENLAQKLIERLQRVN